MTLRSKWIRWGLLATGTLLLVGLVLRIGPREIAHQLARVGPGVVWLAVPYSIGTAISAFPWGMILPSFCRPRPAALVASRFAASGGNALLFGLGGEPCRLLWLRPRDRSLGFAGIVLDRLLYNTSTAIFLLCGALGVLAVTNLPTLYPIIGVLTAFGIFGLSVAAGWAFWSRGLGRRVDDVVRRLRKRGVSDTSFGSDVDAAFRALLSEGLPRLFGAAGVHFVSRVFLAVEVYVALHVLGAPVDVPKALVLASAQVALSAIVSWIPSQIGVHESGQALLCAALGINPALGVAAVLLQRIRQVTFVVATPLLIASAAPERRLEAGST